MAPAIGADEARQSFENLRGTSIGKTTWEDPVKMKEKVSILVNAFYCFVTIYILSVKHIYVFRSFQCKCLSCLWISEFHSDRVTQRGFMGTIAYDYSRSIAEHSVNRRKSPAIAGDLPKRIVGLCPLGRA